MSDFLVGGSVWWALPVVVLTFGVVFGFFPGFVLRLIILLYPADDPRRTGFRTTRNRKPRSNASSSRMPPLWQWARA